MTSRERLDAALNHRPPDAFPVDFNGTAVEFTYFNSMGGVGHGTAAPSGSSADFAMTMQAKPGAPSVAYRTRWTLGADHYDVATDGKPAVRFTRTR